MIVNMPQRGKPSFEEVYEQEFRYVYNFVYMQMMHRENTEDIVSEVFFRAMKNYDSYDPGKASVRTWLITISRNQVINYRKSAAVRKAGVMEEWQDPGQEDQYDIYVDETSREVRQILSRLPEKDRELLVMRFMMEMDNSAIGEVVGASPKTVSQRVMRLLKKCRNMEDFQQLYE